MNTPFISLDWLEINNKIKAHATSEKGKKIVHEIQAFSHPEQALKQQDFIFFAHEILEQKGHRPFFESLDFFDNWALRLKKNAVLKPIELKDIRSFCLELLALKITTQSFINPWAQDINQRLFDAQPPLSAIEQMITPNGEIRSDASQKLYHLFKEKEALAKQIQNTLDRLVKDFDIQEYLQDRYVTTREGRWVIPVKSGRQHAVNGVIHGASQTKQTVYIEPEKVIPINNRLREVEVEIEEEIERLLNEISDYLFKLHTLFFEAFEAMLDSDVIFALAQFSRQIKASRFEFSNEHFEIQNTRHPLMVVNHKNPVPNSVLLTPQKRILLLSGPNAGGKTVLMKAVGLVCHMARCGLPICGSSAKIPFFKNILVGIGDSQKVDEELSTFAAHLKLLNQASHLKGSENLILIDEIASSTDPEEGSALAKAFIQTFSDNHVFAVITSHLSQLKTGWPEKGAVWPGSLEFDLKQGLPTYQFISGVAGQSLALEMAKKIGISASILAQAYDFLSPEGKKRLDVLSETEQIRHDLMSLQEGLKKARLQAEEEQKKYHTLIEQQHAEHEKQIQKIATEARKKIDELIETLKASDSMDRHRKAQQIKMELPQIIKSFQNSGDSKSGNSQNSSHKNLQNNFQSKSLLTKEDFALQYPPGTKVHIKTMSRDGIVQSTPNAKGEVMLLVDSMRLAMTWDQLEPALGAKNPTQALLRSSGVVTSGIEADPVLDCRGLTTTEAIEKLEVQIDLALQRRHQRMKLIHGFGTEALKKALRAHLTRSPYVRQWTSGRADDGGEGVTWIELDLE